MEQRIRILDPWQVWDVSRSCFFVGLQATKQKHKGHRVYQDAAGQKIAIRGGVA